MSNTLALVTYYVVITVGYLWAGVQLIAQEPFDAMVLFAVTFSFQQYRNQVKDLMHE